VHEILAAVQVNSSRRRKPKLWHQATALTHSANALTRVA